MKFIFIIQGEGRGHLTQAITLRKMLLRNGHLVDEVFMGKSPQRSTPGWAEKEIGTSIDFFYSPNFIRRKDRKGVNIFSSFLYNLFRTPIYIYSLFYLSRRIRQSGAEIVVNFYDAIGGIAFCFSFSGKKMFAVSHQQFLEHPVFQWPQISNIQRYLLIIHTRLTSLCAFGKLALSFTSEKNLPEKKIFVMPPLIETEIDQPKTSAKPYVLVYFLNEGMIENLKELVVLLSEMDFIVFTDIGNEKFSLSSNIRILRPDRKSFLSLIPNAEAIISTSGFETVCEAAFHSRAFTPLPSEGHYEQLCNSLDAKRAGLIKDFGNLNSKTLFTLAGEKRTDEFKKWVLEAEDRFMNIFHSKMDQYTK